ncbi:MAG TPA: plastocyanin/azurin family copper-binding protein [Gemmatimonadales bacterium]|nr:plastocyanin/azurin family copper-binding protein [Gemmatimonadales bacterium]
MRLGGVAAACGLTAAAPLGSVVAGRVTMLDKGDRPAEDIGQAVVWLESGAPAAPAPVTAEIGTSDKAFSPHVLVVPAGSTVGFPNHDPFNHNVFSLSEENPFDLGLYSRGETRSVRFARPGIVRVYCNVHAQMSAIVVVRDNPWFVQPASDGSFSLPGVPAGDYTLHLWHERAEEVSREITVPAAGLGYLALELDARGYQFKPHLNKHGQPYPQQGRRY